MISTLNNENRRYDSTFMSGCAKLEKQKSQVWDLAFLSSFILGFSKNRQLVSK